MKTKMLAVILILSVSAVFVNRCCACVGHSTVAILDIEPTYAIAGVTVVTLDGSDSYYTRGGWGAIHNWWWDFDGDGDTDYHEGDGEADDGTEDGITTHTYNTPGVYRVRLAVENSDDFIVYDYKNVYVLEHAPYTYYVRPDGNDSNNGLSWLTAFATIQHAVDEADYFDVIKVAQGSYTENIDVNGVGCTITSTDPNDPNVVANTIIIKGSGGSSAVTFNSSEGELSVLSGFTIKGQGRGIYCSGASPVINNCVLKDNNDSGLYICNQSAPKINNCFFTGNTASSGGAVYNANSQPTFINCVIAGNTASENGAGMYNYLSCPELINCTIVGNDSNDSGDGIYNYKSPAVMTNCLIWDNDIGPVYNYEANAPDSLNLVSWWQFDETSGSIAYDSAGSNNGTLYGPSRVQGRAAFGLDFDGWNDYVSVPDNASLRFSRSSSFSISFWAKPLDIDGWGGTILTKTGGTGCFAYKVSWDISNFKFIFTAYKTDYSSVSVSTSGNSALSGKWYYVTAVYDNTSMKIYLNGELSGTGTFTPDTGGTTPNGALIIGAAPDGYRFRGTIDEVRIYNKAISQQEVRGLGVYNRYCDIESCGSSGGGWDPNFGVDGGGNKDIDPNFATNDYHLRYNSPCINAGDPNGSYTGQTDIDGDPRLIGSNVDIGADEYTGVYYVSKSGNDNNNGLSWAEAFATMQKGINTAVNGQTVMIAQGTYDQNNINFNSKRICVRSTDPNDSAVVAATIINANSTTKDVVIFSGTENANSILDGLTLRHGRYGINCTSTTSQPTITHCRILNNNTYGVYTTGKITLTNTVVAKNKNCGVYLYNSTAARDSIITNCTIYKNTSLGISSYYATADDIKNCIIWGNGNDLQNCSATYSCIEDQDSGTGNIHGNPILVNADANDYHLHYSSPCVNAGDPNSDWSKEPGYPDEPNGRIDIGAYGNTEEATVRVDSDGDGMMDDWEIANHLNPNDGNDATEDLDGDGLRNIDEYHINWDPNNPNSYDGLVYNGRLGINSPSVGMAMDMADNNDVLTLEPGTYYEKINYNGKPITVRSTNPNDPNVVAATIIDANNISTGSYAVTFNTGENSNSVLDGVTVRRGYHGIHCTSSVSPLIRNCRAVDNQYYGIYAGSYCNVEIANCTISGNKQMGIYCDSGTSLPTVSGCRILNNNTYGVYTEGKITLTNTVIAKNNGIGIYLGNNTSARDSIITNCTIYKNPSYGIGSYQSGADDIRNCIIWGNGNDLQNCSATYSCIEDQDSGTGNIHANPLFVNADANDYHLYYSSPCINAGDPNDDWSNEPIYDPNDPNDGIDMGAYGNTAEATTWTDADNDRVADEWEVINGLDPNDPNDAVEDFDDDGLRNIDEYWVGWDPNNYDSNSIKGIVHNNVLDINFPSTSMAMDIADNNEVLTLEPGTYYEKINFNGKPITVRSTDPNDPNVVAATIIDANNISTGSYAVTFNTGENSNSVLDGITVRRGYHGIHCTSSVSPLIRNCRVVDNQLYGIYAGSYCNVEIDNCTISGNKQTGICCDSTTSLPTVSGCRILNNNTYGVYTEGKITLTNTVIAKNKSTGVCLYSSSSSRQSIIANCTIYKNTSLGINSVYGELTTGYIKNCIIWGNDNDLQNCSATYSCIEDQDEVPSNIHGNPILVNADANDYHLHYSSPCINAGDPNSDWSKEPGYPDEPNGRIDMGAYGNTEEATVRVDSDGDGMMDEWEIANHLNPNDGNDATGDLDGDGLRNIDEYHINWDPNNPNSYDGLVYNSRLGINSPSVGMAMDMADNNDVLILEPGTYYEKINFNGKPITVRSTNPNDPNVVAATIIDANNISTGSYAVTFNTGENSNSVLDGITVRRGYHGIHCTSSVSPLIRNCRVVDNQLYGIYAGSYCNVEIDNCTISGNKQTGICCDSTTSLPTVSGCRILNNNTYGVYTKGKITLTNTVIAKNKSTGVCLDSSPSSRQSIIANCTIYKNTSLGINSVYGELTTGYIKNCIIWGNGNDLQNCSATYSCIEDQDSGTGNIHGNPILVNADANDYHLYYSSRCVNGGDPSSDWSGEPGYDPNDPNGHIDMGVYGNTAEATTWTDADNDRVADEWEVINGLDPNDPNDAVEDFDDDGLRNIDEYWVGWDPNNYDSNSIKGIVHNNVLDINFPSTSMAMDIADNNEVLTLEPGTYYEKINFNGKPITVRSTDPNDPNVVAATIIDANNISTGSYAVTFNTGENSNSVLDGITVTGGYHGIYCSVSPLIRNCRIVNNQYYGIYATGGSSCHVEIDNCTISGNKQAGIFCDTTTSLPAISGCRILNNNTYGVYTEGKITLTNTVIAKNKSTGVCLYSSSSSRQSIIANCTIYKNTSLGINSVYGELTTGYIKNCIIWGNDNDLQNCSATYSCIEDQDEVPSNIHADPMFVDADANNFHLQNSSLCVNAGDPNSDWSQEPDYPVGCIDMGAYGNTREATCSGIDSDGDRIPDAWEIAYGLNPNDPNDANGYPSGGHGLRYVDEYYIGWSPDVNYIDSIKGIVHNNVLDINFPSVSMAVGMADNGDVLILEQGTYYEKINFNGKPITVRSTDPNDPNVVASTIIDANNISTGSYVVTFNTHEDSDSVLYGITVRGGYHGIYCTNYASPLIRNCRIVNNQYYGIYAGSSCYAEIDNCTVSGNKQAGICCDSSSFPTVYGCRIMSNNSYGVHVTSKVTLTNTVIAKNKSHGVYLSTSSSTRQSIIANCTIFDNVSYGIYSQYGNFTTGYIKNCIIWGNGDDVSNCSATYSCIENQDEGTGNIHANPMFINADANDYHLYYSSRCVNGGDPSSDWSGEPGYDPNDPNGHIDMGVYGNTAEATPWTDADNDRVADEWEITRGLDPNDANDAVQDPDDNGLRNIDEYYINWDPNDPNSYDSLVYNGRIGINFPSVSMAIDRADNNEVLILEPGTYYEKINFNGKPITVRSTDPNDPNVVASTIIDANNISSSSYVVTFNTGENSNSVLDGVTVRRGYHGIYCTNFASPLIRNCRVVNNEYYGIYAWSSCHAEINNCTISGNKQAGIYCYATSFPTVYGCRIMNNGLYGVQCGSAGGATIRNCVIARNSRYGIYSYNTATTVANCAIYGHNAVSYGFAIYGSCGAIKNCIMWGNNDDLNNCSATYSCIEDLDSGVGNIHTNPMFVNADANDFRLDLNYSPCIDAGEPWADYSQEPMPNGGRLNLGCYGNTPEAEITIDDNSDGISDAWQRHYWPNFDPNDPNYGPNGNPDGDDFSNESEYLFGYDPNATTTAPMLIVHPTLSTLQFDPTQSQSVTIGYWINIDANAVVSSIRNDTSEVVRNMSGAVSVGYNSKNWDGRDDYGEIVEDGLYRVEIDANSGSGHSASIVAGTVEVAYDHEIMELTCNPYRILPLNNEVTTITYDLTVGANMEVDVYDPNGVHFANLLDNEFQSAGSHGLVWTGRNDGGKYITKEGDYAIRVKFTGMREKRQTTVVTFR